VTSNASQLQKRCAALQLLDGRVAEKRGRGQPRSAFPVQMLQLQLGADRRVAGCRCRRFTVEVGGSQVVVMSCNNTCYL
jgi:hypothetical protein